MVDKRRFRVRSLGELPLAKHHRSPGPRCEVLDDYVEIDPDADLERAVRTQIEDMFNE